MDSIEAEIVGGIAERVRLERMAREWSLADLSGRAGVSKAMLSAIERGEASPTAALLVRIAAAYGMTLSALIARAELRGGRLLRKPISRVGLIPRPATCAATCRRRPTCRWN